MSRPSVLVFTRFYLPGCRAGGPIRTISNLVDCLGEEFDIQIITLDRDLGDLCSYPGIIYGKWYEVGKAKVMYVRKTPFLPLTVLRIICNADSDVLYLNGFFDPLFTLWVVLFRKLRIIGGRILLAPRGEFSTAALGLKAKKKALFLRFVKLAGLFSEVVWQASSEFEAKDIRHIMGLPNQDNSDSKILEGNVYIAPNLSRKEIDVREATFASDDRLSICFLGRISRMKNLDYALNVLGMVNRSARFTVYGPIEDSAYWEECEALIRRLPENIEVTYGGHVPHSAVMDTLSSHDLFFLPTRGENFGHVIHEALAAGLPVLISDRTPWRDLQKLGIGWDLSLDHPHEFAQRICEISQWSSEVRNEFRTRAHSFALRVSEDPSAYQANRNIFRQLSSRELLSQGEGV